MKLRRIIEIKTIFIIAFILISQILNAEPPSDIPGRITFLGITANGERSVWLSLTLSGMFEVEARNQVVDQWTQEQPGLHVTFSPVVSNGSGDPHSLFQVINGELFFIDKDNQQGGISFPPLPGGQPPGEVTPPIELPPVEAIPPIYYPPVEGIVPPGETTPPSETTSPGGITPPSGPSPGGALTALSTGGGSSSGRRGLTRTAPITKGREFARQPFWNIWSDNRYFHIVDHRYALDRNGYATNQTIGADRRITEKLVIGSMFAYDTGKSTSFDDNWLINARGFVFGPYFGYLLSSNWGIQGTLAYGKFRNNNNIAILKSRYHSEVYATSLIATGVYNLCSFQLRTKPAIYYNVFRNEGYNMTANVRDIIFYVPIAAYRFRFGYSQLAFELSRPFVNANKITTVPYIELGANYAFTRPNGGQILTGNLTMHKTTPWSGLARVGVRALITKSLFIDCTGNYLSIGQQNLDIWGVKIFLSWAIY